MGMSMIAANARTVREAQQRRRRDGRRAPDLCIDEYMALNIGDPRRNELAKVISVLGLI
jgi:hypothetical protein